MLSLILDSGGGSDDGGGAIRIGMGFTEILRGVLGGG